jgi:hypothetical protein
VNKNKNINRVLIYAIGLPDYLSYFVVNYLNSIARKDNLLTDFILLREFNFKSGFDELIEGDELVFLFRERNNKDFYEKFLKNRPDCVYFYFEDKGKINNILNAIFISINLYSIFLNYENDVEKNNEIIKSLSKLEKSWGYILKSDEIKNQIFYGAKYFLSKRNWKCVGSGVNYISAKYAAISLMSNFKKSCAFDVLENHKHVDVSAEPAVLVFIANIHKSGYQADAFSEIKKMIAHENIPIIVTNIGDNKYDNLNMEINSIPNCGSTIVIPVVKIPVVDSELAFSLNALVVDKFLEQLEILKNDLDFNNVAFVSPSSVLNNL